MRNLVVCCDGTWNTPEQRDEGVPVPTNVVRLYNAVAERDAAGEEQLRYYHPGVGSEGNWWERLAGGSAGVGLTRNVLSAYRWLGTTYRDDGGGDRLFLYGFSRGAYTVRSLAGMIGQCGLLDLTGLDEREVWKRVERAFKEGYRKRRAAADWAGDWHFHGGGPGTTFPIHFIGVWDTVGALGIPDDLTLLNLLDDPKKYAFHATDLGDGVVHARHALALDEMRGSFSPTLWTDVAPSRDVKQVWFPGVHADVGGSYRAVVRPRGGGGQRRQLGCGRHPGAARADPDQGGVHPHPGALRLPLLLRQRRVALLRQQLIYWRLCARRADDDGGANFFFFAERKKV